MEKNNEKVYTEATDRLRELHKNYKGNKAGDSEIAKWFDNCDNNGDIGCFYAEQVHDCVYGEWYKHLTEQEFIEFMGLDTGKNHATPVVYDSVDNPTHYTQGSIEPIDYITANNLNFLEGNVVKYVTRYKHKNGIEDLRKAEFYLKRLIKEYEKD